MKHSIKGLFVILAIVVSFVFVQGVYARDMGKVTKDSFTGVVTSVDEMTRSITLATDDTISHLGPSWYWIALLGGDIGSVIETGDELTIDAVYLECLGEYVGVAIYDEALIIQLRDPDSLKPLWNPTVKTLETSDTAAEATGDGEPNEYYKKYDYDWKNSEEPAPHGKNDS